MQNQKKEEINISTTKTHQMPNTWQYLLLTSIKVSFSNKNLCAPPPFPFLLRGLNLLPNFQKKGGGGLDGTSTFRGGLLGKRG